LLQFLFGFIAGLVPAFAFILGFKVKQNVDSVGTLTGRVKKQVPVWRTGAEEQELEERTEAGA
jgi:hypothetical protein